MIGIYKISSIAKPGRDYIGSAMDIRRRWKEHIGRLRGNRHDNRKLLNHFNKYGETDLQFSILLGCDKEDLLKIEQYFIDSYNPWFNCRQRASSQLGFKHSEESKKKMSEAKLGKHPWNKGKTGIYSKEHRGLISKRNSGKISQMKGRRHTEESKLKNSQHNIGRIPWNKGKVGVYTDEALQKMQKAAKARINQFKGKKHTDKTKQKMREVWALKRLLRHQI